jgi:4-amino-4-deoxy-L-arabinose transferase-like glycosyltransferase
MKSNGLYNHRFFPVFVALVLGLACAVFLPPFSGPDEKPHLAYVAALTQGHLPTIPPTLSADLATGATYQSQHPPLFYLLAAPFYYFFKNNPVAGVYIVRLLCVATLGFTVAMVILLASQLLSPRAARIAGLLAATNPVIVYVSSMVNNESLAVALAVACVWAAARANKVALAEDDMETAETSHQGGFLQRHKFLLLAMLFGGLGMLTKLTAFGGVVAAAILIGHGLPSHRSLAPRFLLLAGAVALWLPWNFVMYRVHGTVMPKLFQAVFPLGFGEALLYPFDAFIAAALSTNYFGTGVFLPSWLMHSPVTEDAMLIYGGIAAVLALFYSLRTARWHFVAAAFITVCALVILQAFFRDADAVLFGARYTPAASIFLTLLVGDAYDRCSSKPKLLLGGLWLAGTMVTFGYLYSFFLNK